MNIKSIASVVLVMLLLNGCKPKGQAEYEICAEISSKVFEANGIPKDIAESQKAHDEACGDLREICSRSDSISKKLCEDGMKQFNKIAEEMAGSHAQGDQAINAAVSQAQSNLRDGSEEEGTNLPPTPYVDPQEEPRSDGNPQDVMTITGQYSIEGSSIMFSPDQESMRRYPTLLVDDGALTIENADQARHMMSINQASLEQNCTYIGRSTIIIRNNREKAGECDSCEGDDCGDCGDPYPVASVVSVKKTTQPEVIPNYTGKCKSGGLPIDAGLSRRPQQLSSVKDVLIVVKSSGLGDWDAQSFQECACAISGNMIEVSADNRIYFYKDGAGDYVVSRYYEDNHGNPYSNFYRFNGSQWVDVSKLVMPGYTGQYNDYFESSSDGVTQWRGEAKPPLHYVYRSGKFHLN